jgi:type II secretory pathway component GspD/PulD (secretin)
MTNITNRIALTAVIEAMSPDYTFDHVTIAKDGTKTVTTYSADDIVEKLTKMIEQLDKKASAPKKPTAKQTESANQAEQVLELLRLAGKAVTVSELIEMFPTELAGLSNQKVASLLRSMLDGKVIRTEEKRKAYFKAVQ